MKNKNQGPFVDNEVVRENVDKIYSELEPVSDIEYHSIIEKLGWKRPWRWIPTFWSKENWLFQFYHVFYVIIVFWPLVFWPHKWYGWALASLFFALGREYEQWKNWDWKVLMLPDRLLDILGHVLGSQALFWGIKIIF